MPPYIIGILGRSRVGKDTVTNILVQEFRKSGYDYNVVRLASPIKDAAKALFNFTPDQIEGSLKESIDPLWGVTPRAVFQKITRATMDEMGTNFFTRLLYRKYDTGQLGQYIVIPDVRFDHDVNEIHQRGGIVIKVERRASNIIQHTCEDNIDALAGDVTIRNNSSVLELASMVRLIMNEYI